MIRHGWLSGLQTPSANTSSAKNGMKCSFLDYFHFCWWSGLVDELDSSNPICHPSPAKKMKCSFLDYKLLMISRTGLNGLESHLPPLSSQNDEMPIFVLCWTSNNQPGCSMDSNPIHYPSPAKIMKCLFLHYIQLLMISWAGQWTWIPICHLSPAKKMKCSFLDYVQLLMISWAGQWIWTLSNLLKKWNAHFWIMFNFWWSAWLVNGFEPCPPPLSSQKNEMLIFGLHSTSDDQYGWSMDLNPVHQLSPAKKMKCSFLD